MKYRLTCMALLVTGIFSAGVVKHLPSNETYSIASCSSGFSTGWTRHEIFVVPEIIWTDDETDTMFSYTTHPGEKCLRVVQTGPLPHGPFEDFDKLMEYHKLQAEK